MATTGELNFWIIPLRCFVSDKSYCCLSYVKVRSAFVVNILSGSVKTRLDTFSHNLGGATPIPEL